MRKNKNVCLYIYICFYNMFFIWLSNYNNDGYETDIENVMTSKESDRRQYIIDTDTYIIIDNDIKEY